MAITKEQAILEDEFHTVGQDTRVHRNKSGLRCYVWQRNGQTKTWVTRPDKFQVPVKYGMYEHGYITQVDAGSVYTRGTCPVCNPPEALEDIAGRIAREVYQRLGLP